MADETDAILELKIRAVVAEVNAAQTDDLTLGQLNQIKTFLQDSQQLSVENTINKALQEQQDRVYKRMNALFGILGALGALIGLYTFIAK